MKKLMSLAIAVLMVIPAVFAYQSYGDYDYSYTKDFNYVNYHETEDMHKSYDSCGYYDYDYYGSRCGRNSNYEYHRSRDFQFGNYHEETHASGNYGNGYYNSHYDGFSYPSDGYSDGFDYEGGRSFSGGLSGYMTPFEYY